MPLYRLLSHCLPRADGKIDSSGRDHVSLRAHCSGEKQMTTQMGVHMGPAVYWKHYPEWDRRSAKVLAAVWDQRKVFGPLPQRDQHHPRSRLSWFGGTTWMSARRIMFIISVRPQSQETNIRIIWVLTTLLADRPGGAARVSILSSSPFGWRRPRRGGW